MTDRLKMDPNPDTGDLRIIWHVVTLSGTVTFLSRQEALDFVGPTQPPGGPVVTASLVTPEEYHRIAEMIEQLEIPTIADA